MPTKMTNVKVLNSFRLQDKYQVLPHSKLRHILPTSRSLLNLARWRFSCCDGEILRKKTNVSSFCLFQTDAGPSIHPPGSRDLAGQPRFRPSLANEPRIAGQ